MSFPATTQTFSGRSLLAWKVVISVLYGAGIAASAARLIYRYRSKSLGVDDYFALLVPISSAISAGVIWPLYKALDSHDGIPEQVTLYWVMSVSWLITIWSSRIALGFTLKKTIPEGSAFRMAFNVLLICFAILLFGNIPWLVTTGCTHMSRFQPDIRTLTYCNANRRGYAIINFISLFYSEIWLIIIPVLAHIKSRLSVSQSRTLQISACLSAVLIVLTSLHAAVYFSPLVVGSDGLFTIDMAQHLEAALSAIVCNVPILVAFFFWARRGEAENGTVAVAPTFQVSLNETSKQDDEVSIASREVKDIHVV
ncbi:hypothetical protein FA15DRAFT_68098 [Coprinopsis marcescibilis]|uniref:Uncharacterized protein n=1 Tax=Coprinopsis marcescibilis TaxID=230819 RepID=A0A5C3KN78_COPMA|nr:hypothetical protein FA15DRAFT_68098 [Coprinopsis marcescibilis]